jgi:hypothetical protein
MDVVGTVGGASVSGVGYVELVGYRPRTSQSQ